MGRLYVMLCLATWLLVEVKVEGIGANWGTQTSHPLSPNIVVQMLRDNGIQKVKLFDAEDSTLIALKKTNIEVMVGIPNELLESLATSMQSAENWVARNVSGYVSDGVNIRYVAVGNEPFLKTFNGSFLQTTFPALQNIQSALIKAGLSSQVKVTCPQNADVYQSETGKPSDGDFRADIRDFILPIVKFLNDNASPFTVNIYPFISLYTSPDFPIDYAFFDGSNSSVPDGATTYTNMFDANHDTLVWALRKNGFPNLPIIIGEIGWPTDGDMNANPQLAQKFNQGFLKHISNGQGTPMKPGPVNAYLFSLIDEDQKSIQPGNFERHWGLFNYDGSAKYQLSIGNSNSGIVPAKGVKYLDKRWCVLKPSVDLDDSKVPASVSYACARADCTSLGYKTSCSDLDARGNISYAYNSYYQINDQDDRACGFSNLATTTNVDPSTKTCRFPIEILVDDSGVALKVQLLMYVAVLGLLWL